MLLINIFVMAPLVVGMSAVAGPLFKVLLGEKWLLTVPYFEVLALSGIFYPLAMVAYNVLKIKMEYAFSGFVSKITLPL